MGDKPASKTSKGAYGFDPVGLERAAKAAKELDSSPNSKLAFELALKQEETKSVEAQAQIKQLDMQRIRYEQEQKRLTMEKELEISKQKSLMDHELARERYREQLAEHAAKQEEIRRREEESVAKQEQMKRQTIQYEQQLRREADQARMIAKERAKAERLIATKDLRHEDIKLKEEERRRTLREIWSVNLEAIGSGLRSYLSDFRNIAFLAGGLTLTFFGFQFAKAAGRVTTSWVEARMGKPSLIRETTRKTSAKQWLMLPAHKLYSHTLVKGRFLPTTNKQREKDILEGIFINEDLEHNLRTVSHSIINRKKHYAPFRNLLLYGPPGTGKTMFARSLAEHSGMDYAIFTGGDIGPLGKEGTTELHKLFDWASTSKKGVLLFMDEADAFLRKRTTEKISEDMRNALNALLFRTGTASHNFMLVLASNAPEQLDRAIHDRIDEMVFFDKPGYKQRLQMIYHYIVKYCTPSSTLRQRIKQYVDYPASMLFKKTEIGMQGVEEELLDEVARKTEGFSGREIYKLVIAWHNAAFNQEQAILTPEIIHSVLESHLKQHEQRKAWENRGADAPAEFL